MGGDFQLPPPKGNKEALIQYLSPMLARGKRWFVRWVTPPIVRVANETCAEHVGIVEEAVEKLNCCLPDFQMEFEPLGPEPLTSEVPEGEIYVDFALPTKWKHPAPPENLGRGDVFFYPAGIKPRDRIKAGHVWMRSFRGKDFGHYCREDILCIVAHELIHTLGFFGHPSKRFEGISIMVPKYNDLGGLIKFSDIPMPIDCDAVKTIYSIPNGTFPTALPMILDENGKVKKNSYTGVLHRVRRERVKEEWNVQHRKNQQKGKTDSQKKWIQAME